MPTYYVKWMIEVEAESALEAALEARRIQLDPNSTAVMYECCKATSPIREYINLFEED
jgi:hypothetical protein